MLNILWVWKILFHIVVCSLGGLDDNLIDSIEENFMNEGKITALDFYWSNSAEILVEKKVLHHKVQTVL